MEFLGIITARGGSKGILRKNIKKLAGKPLIQYTFNVVKKSRLLNRCIVSTDSDEIIEYSKSEDLEVPFKRPKELARDESKSIDTLIHAVKYLKNKEDYEPDYVITLQPTSPLRLAKDIDNAINLIKNDKKADSLVSIVKVPHNYHLDSIMILKNKYLKNYHQHAKIKRRQELSTLYARNGAAIYITKLELLMERKILGNYCLPYIMPKERSIDIDDMFDWKIAEFLLKDI